MKKFTPGKYVNAEFTKEQEQARKIWQRSMKRMVALSEVLQTYPTLEREYLHQRLDHCLDNIERMQSKAQELFVEVSDSFTIASMKI